MEGKEMPKTFIFLGCERVMRFFKEEIRSFLIK